MTTLPAPNPAQTQQAGRGVLQLEKVNLEYPDGIDEAGQPAALKALDEVNFSASTGEISAIIGASGSGKSSLLSVAATLITPTSGSVFVDGVETTNLSEKERAALRAEKIGIIFQQPNLLPSLTALEQLTLIAHMNGARGKALKTAQKRARELLDLVGLSAAETRRAHQLSGGQRQRVNIARALMGSPTLLLADEPTSALDAERSASILELLKQITVSFDLATIMVTHDLAMADSADTVLKMKDGAAHYLP